MNKHLLSLLALASVPVLAATPINEQALQACSFIENDFNRLLCYDNTIAGKSLTQPAHKQPQQSVKANVKLTRLSQQHLWLPRQKSLV